MSFSIGFIDKYGYAVFFSNPRGESSCGAQEVVFKGCSIDDTVWKNIASNQGDTKSVQIKTDDGLYTVTVFPRRNIHISDGKGTVVSGLWNFMKPILDDIASSRFVD